MITAEKILTSSGVRMNPATQETLAAIKAKTDNLDVLLSSRLASGQIIFGLPFPAGTHGNAWSNVAVAANGLSAMVDLQYQTTVSIFGNSNGASTLGIQVSQDGVNFYTLSTLTIATGNFGTTIQSGARYMRLSNLTARTITATIAGK